MKIGSPYPEKKARIEIIPLIDIMFFLLASFMMASLSMMKLQSIKMNLPTATVARRDKQDDMVKMSVDQFGNASVNKQSISQPDLEKLLAAKLKTNATVPVYITGDPDASHGMIIHWLDVVRGTGVQNVSFAIAVGAGGAKH
jgi:biopolymer transport protein ExbD